jgi:hypothetical protein
MRHISSEIILGLSFLNTFCFKTLVRIASDNFFVYLKLTYRVIYIKNLLI